MNLRCRAPRNLSLKSGGRRIYLGLSLWLSFGPWLAASLPAQEAALPSAELKISFDPGFDALVPAKRSASGDILVQPTINDQEAGWFRLDPATEGMRISALLAKSLGLTQSGTVRLITSSDKLAERPVWSGARFRLGPLVAEGLEFAEMSETSSPAEEEAVVGVVGTGVLQAAVAEIELDSGGVRLFNPAAYEAGDRVWQTFSFQGGLPAFSCRFEGDRQARFGLDLRSPLGIVFFSETVASLELLKDRPSQRVKVSGTTFSQVSAQSGSLQWFEAAGLRLESPRAVFLTGKTGLSIEKNLAGLLGQEVLRGCTLIIDCAQKRISLQKQPEGV